MDHLTTKSSVLLSYSHFYHSTLVPHLTTYDIDIKHRFIFYSYSYVFHLLSITIDLSAMGQLLSLPRAMNTFFNRLHDSIDSFTITY